jgi:hypothetical protein
MILLAQLRKVMRKTELNKKYTARELLWEMESLTTIINSGRYKNKTSEVSKNQRIILEAFDVELPK